MQGATATFTRAAVFAAKGVGVVASRSAEVTLRDLSVEDTTPWADGSLGMGLAAQTGASVTVQRARLRGNRGAGLVSMVMGRLSVTDVEVVGTHPFECYDGVCGEDQGGMGLAVIEGAADVERFVIADNALVGVQLQGEAGVDLRDGLVARHPIGLNVQVPDYDLGRLQENVRYLDNDVNLDATELPVPGAVPDIPSL